MAYLALAARILLLGLEKIVITRLARDSAVEAALLFFAVAIVFLLPFLWFVPVPVNYDFVFYTIVAGFLYSIAFALFAKSLAIGEVSLVSPLYNFNVFFLVILTWIFLGESLTILKSVGLFVLVCGASLLTPRTNIWYSFRALFSEKSCLYMISCSLLIAIGRTIDGFIISNGLHPLVYAFYLYVAISFFLVLYLSITGRLPKVGQLLLRQPGTAIFAGMINAYSYCCLLIAFTKIEVSIAEPASMLGGIVTIIMAYFFFHEKIGRRLVAATIMFAGVIILFWMN